MICIRFSIGIWKEKLGKKERFLYDRDRKWDNGSIAKG